MLGHIFITRVTVWIDQMWDPYKVQGTDYPRTNSCLSLGSLPPPEARSWDEDSRAQSVHRGWLLETPIGGEDLTQGGKDPCRRHQWVGGAKGNWGSVQLGASGRSIRTHVSSWSHPWSGQRGHLFSKSHLSSAQGCSQGSRQGLGCVQDAGKWPTVMW